MQNFVVVSLDRQDMYQVLLPDPNQVNTDLQKVGKLARIRIHDAGEKNWLTQKGHF